MREHSGAEGKNNNRNPTLRDQELESGRSGEAIQGEKKTGTYAKHKPSEGKSP